MPSFGPPESAAARTLIELALHEDLDDAGDRTSQSVIDARSVGTVHIVARKSGRLAGLPIVAMVFAALDAEVAVLARRQDGDVLAPGDVIAALTGPVRGLLTGERTALNFLTALSGVASLTALFTEAVAQTQTQILDTRKTWPGWRVLQKYAVRCGGGVNHRMGLYDGVMLKDNHLAAWIGSTGTAPLDRPTIAEAIVTARRAIPKDVPITVEVDSLSQLGEALPGEPDVVLLDNMDVASLRAAVHLRDESSSTALLEASGGVTLDTVAGIAQTGVERISIGALTHSAPALDLAFDWSELQHDAQRAARAPTKIDSPRRR